MHPGSLLFGLSQWFVELVLEAARGIECDAEWNHSNNSFRNCDFFEVFSGRGALSTEMIRVALLHCFFLVSVLPRPFEVALLVWLFWEQKN